MTFEERIVTPSEPAKFNPNSKVQARVTLAVPHPDETPADFIKRQLAGTDAPLPVETPPAPSSSTPGTLAKPAPKDVPPVQHTLPDPPKEEPLTFDEILSKELSPDLPKETPSVPAPTPHHDPEEITEADTTKENIKKLRVAKKEAERVAEETRRLLEESSEKVARYEAGEIHAPVLEEQAREIERLRPYESMVSLKTSKAYEEKFLKPVIEKENQLKAIAKDYDVDDATLRTALGITNRKELAYFLSSHFSDVDALEVKTLIKDIQTINTEALQAEKEPVRALERLKAEQEVIREQQKQERGHRIAAISKKGWMDSMKQVQAEGQLKAFIPDAASPEHNEKFVGPITKAAAHEYAKIVRGLFDAGLEDLPEELAFALARLSKLAHASAVHSVVADAAIKERNEAVERMRTRSRVENPPIGQSGRSDSSFQPEKPLPSMKEQTTSLLRNVGVKI